MSSPFTDFRIMPSYSRGFVYTWDIAGDFNDHGPWLFTVQEGQSPDGPWENISPELENACMWAESTRKLVNKANVLYYRIRLKTGSSKGKTHYSPVIQPYGALDRRDFLLAREVMRQSMLHSKGMAGVQGDVYILSTFGPKCTHCLDPITGMIRDSHCSHCFGTGRSPAFYGPYKAWLNFTEDNQHQVDTDKTGTVEKKSFQVQMIGNPVLKHGDAIVIPGSDKRYYVDIAAITTEIRRIPVLQTLSVEEAPQSDKIYDL